MGEGGRISWVRLVLGGILALAVASVVLALVGPLIAQRLAGGSHYQINDSAMAPTLLVGDWVLASPLPPDALPRRGDIVAYRDPLHGRADRIGRVVALPGDRVQMRGGALYLNGRRLDLAPAGERLVVKRPPGRRAPTPLCLDDPVPMGDLCRQEVWRETPPEGPSRRVLNSRGQLGLMRPGSRRSGDDTGLLRVSEDHVFILGDNRDQAVDSRAPKHGPVPLEAVRHRVWMIHTSLDRSSRLPWPRWTRFFREVE